MAKTFTPFGPEFQINVNSGGNNGISGAQDLASLAALSDGRFVVAYQSDYFGSATDTDPIVAIFNASGSTSLSYRDVFNFGALQKVPAVAERLDGGFGVVFQNDRHANGTVDANGPNITYVPVSAAGGVLSPIGVGDFNAGAGHDALQNPEIATLSSGRQVVAFERVWTAGTDHDVFLNVVNAAGTATQFSIANPPSVSSDASWQANPSVAAIGDVALVVYEDGTGTSTASANIRGRFFDGDSNTLGAAFTIADHAGRLRTADVAAIDDHRYAITYGDQNDVWVKVLDSTTEILSAEIQLDVTGGFSLNPQVSGAPGAGFVVTWAQYNGADYDVRARLFDGNVNAVGSDFIVTSLTNASQFTPDVTVSGTHVFFAWTDFAARPEDTAAPGIRGRMFSVNDPPNDFNGDGKSDFLWQTDGGSLAMWEMNGFQISAADYTRLGSSAVGLPGADWHVVDTGDFDGDGKTDILWRTDSGAAAIWEMDGTHIKAADFTRLGSTAVGAPGVDWHQLGAADFDGDGKAGILWRTDSGALAIWEMDGTHVKAADYIRAGSTAVGVPASDWKIVGVGDFDGDGNNDLLWETGAGALAVWQMNGTHIKSADYVKAGSTITGMPGADWHVADVGDFDGDGNADILWRVGAATPETGFAPGGGQLAIWEMNGNQIEAADYTRVGSTLVGAPGLDWHLVGSEDYNGDGINDIAWRTDSGILAIWQMYGTQIAAADYTKTGSTIVGAPATDWQIFQHHYDLV